MGFSFYNILNGLRLIPKASGTNSNAGDMEFLTSDNKIHVFNGTVDSALATESGATLTDPNITVKVNPIKFEDPGAGTNKVSVSAPSGLAGSYNFVLPPDDGNLDDILRTDGSGNTSWVAGGAAGLVPTGVVLDFAGNTVPAGFLLCYGQAVSRSTYSALFTVIGILWGAGNGTTTFNLPDLRGNISAGRDDMGGVASGRLTTDTINNPGNPITVGSGGGQETNSLIRATMPSHFHALDSFGATAAITNPAITGSVTMNTSAVSGTVGGSDGTHTHGAGTLANASAGQHTHGTNANTANGSLVAQIGIAGASNLIGQRTASSSFTDNNAGAISGAAGTGSAWAAGSVVAGVTTTANADSGAHHTHTISGNTNNTGSGHGHAFSLTAAAQTQLSQTYALTNAALSGDTGADGQGLPFSNVQPTVIMNKMIKY